MRPSFRAVIGFRVICPMESSVLFRFAAADLFRRIKPCAIVALLAKHTIQKGFAEGEGFEPPRRCRLPD